MNKNQKDAIIDAADHLTSFLLDNTDDNQGFEAIPDIDDARTLLMEVTEDAGKQAVIFAEADNLETPHFAVIHNGQLIFGGASESDAAYDCARTMAQHLADTVGTKLTGVEVELDEVWEWEGLVGKATGETE